jgi:hypothetical protein
VKVLEFTPKKEHTVCMPTEAYVKDLINNKELKSLVLIIVNEEDSLSYMYDGANPMEVLGLLETTKFTILAHPMEELTDDE